MDRVLQSISIGFDPSVWQIFTPLWQGACLVLLPPGRRNDTAYIAELMVQERITMADFPPSLLQTLLEEPAIGECTTLRYLYSGAEALSLELEKLFYARACGKFQNQYGPTETAIDATSHTCESENRRSSVPIGRPIANKRIYILDGGEPEPIGFTGELHIGGEGIARGYQRRPDLTAERFLPDPFGVEPGARLYRTGDLARYRPDGVIEFAGRIDDQVKIRGYRVEPGEVKARLLSHPLIIDAAVTAIAENSSTKRLVAYIVLKEPVSSSELRSYLRSSLPEQMVPSMFAVADSIPRLPTGKVDRRSLSRVAVRLAEPDEAYVAPRTSVEEILAGIWAQLLGIERVGVHDDFFELGGHSLLVTRVTSRMRAAFSIELSPRALFSAPTVAQLAEVVEEKLLDKVEEMTEAEAEAEAQRSS
jgi:acyl-coenzyme A synthetase/AMP-(fatty) acid ligase